MKRIASFLSVIILGFSPVYSQYVNIPDSNFLNTLIGYGVDTNGDGQISYEEAAAVNYLYLSYDWWWQIKSLTGIEAFINLDTLYCSGNLLSSLDVSGCTALKVLDCSHNKLINLNISGCADLKVLHCADNQLDTLDVAGSSALVSLKCENNRLASLEVSGCTALQELKCSGNQLTGLHFSGHATLRELDCRANLADTLDVAGCTALQLLFCDGNPITSLDVSGCTALYIITCNGNQLTSLDVSDCTALELLECHGDLLTTLDISGCTYLYELDLSNMPNLQMVCIWFVPPPIYINTTGSPNVYFTTECITDAHTPEAIGEIRIYPNPDGYLLHIETGQPGPYTIEITSLNGRLLDITNLEGKTHQLDMTRYDKSVYIITVRSETFVRTGKVIRY
jgi:Leucine-rich repeat (LRR) protein